MKKLISVALLAMMVIACSQSSRSEGSEPEIIGVKGGCTLYVVHNDLRAVYWSVCAGMYNSSVSVP